MILSNKQFVSISIFSSVLGLLKGVNYCRKLSNFVIANVYTGVVTIYSAGHLDRTLSPNYYYYYYYLFV